MFALLWLADVSIAWARREPRKLRPTGIVSFATGLISGIFALTLWLAFLALVVAPIGVGAACFALREETTNREGHSLLNPAGLLLNFVALGVLVSQVITATIWR